MTHGKDETMNVIIGVICLAMGVFLYASTFGYPHHSPIGMTPGTWPRMIAFFMGIFSVILIVQGISSKRALLGFHFSYEKFVQAIKPSIAATYIILYIIAWSHWRTFFLPTFLLTAMLVALLKPGKKSISSHLLSGIIGLAVTTIIFCVFYYVFRLPL